MKPSLRSAIGTIGGAMTPAMFRDTAALFAPHVLRPGPPLCRVERDIAYGEDERHRLDVYLPRDIAADAPVVLYVHGGGFVQGDKGGPESPFHGHIGAWAASLGMVGITMNYRLAPAHPWPAGAEDLAAAIAWIAANASRMGFSAPSLFLMGQSAGAAHVASYLSLPDLHPADGPLAGAIMLSGLYDLARLEHSPFEAAYYGSDPSCFEEQSSLSGLVRSEVPCLFTVAEYDGPSFQQQAAYVVEAWMAAKGHWPRMLFIPDGNHMSAALGLGCEGDLLSIELDAFIDKVRGKAGADGDVKA